MTTLGLLLALCFGTARAEEAWKNQPIETKMLTDFTAYTVPVRSWRVGLGKTQVGLLDNLHLGTSQFLFLFGVPNVNAKVTAIQMPRFDAAFQAGFMGRKEENGGRTNTTRAIPLRWTGSVVAHKKVSIHFGAEWVIVDIDGEQDGASAGSTLAPILGADVSANLVNTLGVSTYTDTHFTVTQSRFALDWRLNRRDSIVLASNAYVLMNGLVISGVTVEPEEGQEVSVGAAARVKIPLEESIPAVGSLSWQWSWEKLHLRIGIPLSSGASILFAIPQAFDLYWVLGGRPKRAGRA